MAKQAPEERPARSTSSETTFSELKKQIAERNEQVHKEAREHRAKRELDQLKIVSRRKLDLD